MYTRRSAKKDSTGWWLRFTGGFQTTIFSGRCTRRTTSPAPRPAFATSYFRFGGPPTYIEERGHPRLRIRHAPYVVDTRARDRWVALMNEAFAEAALPAEAEQTLRPFFEHVATFLINRQES